MLVVCLLTSLVGLGVLALVGAVHFLVVYFFVTGQTFWGIFFALFLLWWDIEVVLGRRGNA